MAFTVWWILLFFVFPFGENKQESFYRSPALDSAKCYLWKEREGYVIRDDNGESVSVSLLADGNGRWCWYRRVFTEVCLTGECRPIDVGLYAKITGKYLGLEVYRESLTKADHSDFTAMDYVQLESVLQNEWSDLREYEVGELLEPASGGRGEVDGVTGATRMAVGKAAVKGAIYTTYTIWHLIHVGEPEQLALLAQTVASENPSISHDLLASADPNLRDFVFNGVAEGRLQLDSVIESMVLKELLSGERVGRDIAIKAMEKLNMSSERVQNGIALAYPHLALGETVRVLSILGNADTLSSNLRMQLFGDFTGEKDSRVILKIIQIFNRIPVELTKEERTLLLDFKTDNSLVTQALRLYLGLNLE